MPDEEKGSALHASEQAPTDPSEEAAATKLWAVYVSEADKYDKALVESWKSDMEGMLIFAGLFSASLTAFIIESYKTLTPDSRDTTVQLLTQISQQLAAAANGITFTPPAPTVFSPPATSLVCNALWFISLGLSLTCALIATLLEQWARDFLHRADMRSAPVIRARIFAYLYYGLKRFNMHIVVEIIPLLLHASLVFFFAGLVAFLIPVNTGMAGLAAALLATVAAVYSFLTLIPLWYLDCPYRTPLSGAFWRLSRRWPSPLSNSDSSSTETMVQAMSNCATEPSAARTSRDLRALAWTVSSLADDTELEPFVEGIPDVLWGPTERRYSYDEHIQRLMRDPHLQLLLRVEGLLRSCDTGLLSPEAFTRRQITCYKALWAIASLQNPGSSLSHQPLNFRFDYPRRIHRAHIGQYSISAWALMDWNVFCSMLGRLAELSTYLAVCEAEYHNGGHTPNLQPVTSYLESAMESLNISLSETPEIMHYILYGVAEPTVSPLRLIAGLSRVLVILRTTTPHRILFRYLERCAELESPPYRWKDTRARISLDNTAQFSAFKDILERTLERVIVGGGLDRLNDVKTSGWMDTIVQELYASWMPDQTSEPTALPTGIIHYLINRTSDTALSQFVSNHHLEMRSAFPITLSATRPVIDPYGREIKIDETLAALWRILSLPLRIPTFNMEKPWSIFDAILEKVIDSGRSNSSVIAMVKTKILDNLGWWIEEFPHSVLCTETAHARASEFREEEGYVLRNHIIETSVALLAEFLEDCNSTLVLYKAAETIRHIGASAVPRAEIHASHQVRLANGMHRAANVDKPDVDLIDAVISCRMFDLYTQPGPSESHPWLDDPIARSQIQDALSAYANSSPIISPISLRAQAIIEGLDRLHVSSFASVIPYRRP